MVVCLPQVDITLVELECIVASDETGLGGGELPRDLTPVGILRILIPPWTLVGVGWTLEGSTSRAAAALLRCTADAFASAEAAAPRTTISRCLLSKIFLTLILTRVRTIN